MKTTFGFIKWWYGFKHPIFMSNIYLFPLIYSAIQTTKHGPMKLTSNGINQKSIPLFVYLRVYLIIVYWINQFFGRINLFRHLCIPWSWDLLICSHAFLVWMQNAILQQMRPNADIGGTKNPDVHISTTVT